MTPPEEQPPETPSSDAPQRRLQPRGAADETHGATPVPDHQEPREEVAGQGSGPLFRNNGAGGPPATANGDNRPANELAFDPADLDREGGPSNTPSQKTPHPHQLTLGGEDWLTVNFYVNHHNLPGLVSQLDAAQAAALAERIPDDEIQLGDVRCLVAPTGASQGDSAKGLRYRWRLTTEQGITVLLTSRPEAHETQPNVSVTARSLLLMRNGFDAVWALMRYVVEQLGCQIVKNKISRVDPCIDLPGIPVTIFCDALADDCFVTRAKKRQQHAIALHSVGRLPTGFTIGKTPLMLRVYDKLRQSANDPLKLAVLDAHRWDGRPKTATRVEFQLNRAKLKAYGVDTVEDWIEKRADIVDRLTRSWFRLTEGPVDRDHADRTPTHPFWDVVQKRFAECYGAARGVDLSPKPTLTIDTSQRVAVVVGVLVGLFARSGIDIADNAQFLSEATREIAEAIRKRDLRSEVIRKAIELGVEGL